jgi:hypothetical protein
MRNTILLAALIVTCFAQGEEALPHWPEIGSRWDLQRARAEVPAERLGTAYWNKPPAVISPYETNWYDYVPIMWGSDSRINDPVVYNNALRKMYICAGLNYSDANPNGLAKAKMPFYCTNLCNQLFIANKSGPASRESFLKSRTRTNCVRIPSLEDSKVDQDERNNATTVAKLCGALKPLGYDLRDEGSYTTGFANPHDFDFAPVSMSAFRKWLKSKYGTLDALNEEWQAHFSTWDAVFPLTTDEIQAREYSRVANANFAPWADHREYNDDTFFSAIARYRDAVRTADPGAAVGYSGTQMPSAWGGFDFWKLGNTLGWIEYYDVNGSRELLSSFLPRHYPALAAVNFDSVDRGLENMWHKVLHGDAGGLVWPYAGDIGINLLLDVKEGQATLTSKGEIMKTVFREARSGIPCLLRRAEPVVNPIGVLYSQASLRADWMFEVKDDGKTWYQRYSSYESAHNIAAAGREGIYKLIQDVGLQFQCYSSEQVEHGELLKSCVKLFIVPRGLALSKKEIEGLTAFVEAGGVLVTDILAGRMNDNCRMWPNPGPLDALLGVKRAPFAFETEGSGFGRPIDVTLEANFGGLKVADKLIFKGYQETGLQAGTAKALAKTEAGPALLENARGKGFAYTLNFDLPNYLAERANKDDAIQLTASARRMMVALARKAGIEPALKVRAKGADEHPMGIEAFGFNLGAAQLFALHTNGSVRINWENLADTGAGVNVAPNQELTIQLPKKGYVTELRTRKSFGLTDKVEVKLEKGRPMILSVLPYEVKALNVNLGAGKLVDGKIPLEVSVETTGEPLDHVVHVELLDEKGESVPESVMNLPLPKGRYTGAIDLSFVPDEGPWKLRLTDVASGKLIESPVTK